MEHIAEIIQVAGFPGAFALALLAALGALGYGAFLLIKDAGAFLAPLVKDHLAASENALEAVRSASQATHVDHQDIKQLAREAKTAAERAAVASERIYDFLLKEDAR